MIRNSFFYWFILALKRQDIGSYPSSLRYLNRIRRTTCYQNLLYRLSLLRSPLKIKSSLKGRLDYLLPPLHVYLHLHPHIPIPKPSLCFSYQRINDFQITLRVTNQFSYQHYCVPSLHSWLIHLTFHYFDLLFHFHSYFSYFLQTLSIFYWLFPFTHQFLKMVDYKYDHEVST